MSEKYPLYNIDHHIDFLAKHKGRMYKEFYQLGYDIEDAIRLFQTGPLADEWDTGVCYLIKFPADNAALRFVCELRDHFGINVKQNRPETYKGGFPLPREYNGFNVDALEWTGQIYEMWAKYAGLSSKEVYNKLPFPHLYIAYTMGAYDDPYNFMLKINRAPEEYIAEIPLEDTANKKLNAKDCEIKERCC